jgi:hypothetical protein
MGDLQEFTVVMRGPSALVFREKEGWSITPLSTENGNVSVAYTTRWISRRNDLRMPGHLWIEAKGQAKDLKSALHDLSHAALIGLAPMSLACNAAIRDPSIEVAFASTGHSTERDFFQVYVAPEGNELSSARLANHSAIAKVFEAIMLSPHKDRVLRAANQYRVALDSWQAGRETLVLAHLWMAVEALTEAEVRELLAKYSVSQAADLARIFSVEEKQLRHTIRRDVTLCGDGDCYKQAREASDGFEHGYLDFWAIHTLAVDVTNRLARYVREAIFRLINLDSDTHKHLTGEPYLKPLSASPLTKHIQGVLRGTSNNLARPENAYPFIRWNFQVNTCDFDASGKMQISLGETFTPEIGDGITFTPTSLQIWSSGAGIQFANPDQATTVGNLRIAKAVESQVGFEGTCINDPSTEKWLRPVAALILNCNSILFMSIRWVERLLGTEVLGRRSASLQRNVDDIFDFLDSNPNISGDLVERIKRHWLKALDLDQVRIEVSAGAGSSEGLMLLGEFRGLTGPIFNEAKQLSELVDLAVETAQAFPALMQELDPQLPASSDLQSSLSLNFRRLMSLAFRLLRVKRQALRRVAPTLQ